jgi:hypothetical protein
MSMPSRAISAATTVPASGPDGGCEDSRHVASGRQGATIDLARCYVLGAPPNMIFVKKPASTASVRSSDTC